MNAWQRAHQRCLEALRDHIRTHYRAEPQQTQRLITPNKKRDLSSLKERLLRLQQSGMDRKTMAAVAHTTNKTIVKLLGNVRPAYPRRAR